MSDYKAFMNYDMLKRELNEKYGIFVDAIELVNDFCSSVYFVSSADKKFIFKLYRSFDTDIALQSANIMDYLLNQSFPVAPIIYTRLGHSSISLFFSEGNRVGILFEFIDGVMGYDLDFGSYAVKMGETMSLMHTIMDKYDKPIVRYGKEHYVGRYINLLKEFNYTPYKIDELEEYGSILWDNVARTKPGFCHGDFNPSNFIKTSDDKYYIFDFDCAGIAYPINDVFTICNITNTFVRFDITEYVDPAERFLLFKQGYNKYRKLDDYDISAMYSFVGLSCYWMAAQFDKYRSPLEGRQWLNEKYFDNNYDWLMNWRNASKKTP